jgi:hypothetical protein
MSNLELRVNDLMEMSDPSGTTNLAAHSRTSE